VVVVQRQSDVTSDDYDYVDAFRASVDQPDTRSAEEVFRAGLEDAPRWLRVIVLIAHRHVLRFELAPPDAAKHVMGWEVLAAEYDEIRLRAAGPLIRGLLVARRTGPQAAVLETYVKYQAPVLGRVVWTAVAPIHRAVAPYLLRRAAMSASR
jgi:hypothetical protein